MHLTLVWGWSYTIKYLPLLNLALSRLHHAHNLVAVKQA